MLWVLKRTFSISSQNTCLINAFKPSVLFYGTSANSVEPDQTRHNVAFDLVLHCCLQNVLLKFNYIKKMGKRIMTIVG